MGIKTVNEVREWLKDNNLTVAQWARENGHNSVDVTRVLTGKSKCRYGQGRAIAIKLGLRIDE